MLPFNKITLLKTSMACCFIIASNYSNAQLAVTNDGLAITLTAGLTATIEGSFTNQTNGASPGTVDNAGTITLTGDWTNNSANTVFSTNTGLVQFLGTANAQTIGGTNSTGFYDVTLNNTFVTFPQLLLGLNTTIKNTLTMTAGNMNLAGFTTTLGTSSASPGTLAYTAGFLYGGNFKRWMAASQYGVTTAPGHFPMGGSGGEYRPFWMGITSADLASGGTVTVNHNAVYPIQTNPAGHLDATWGGGTTVARVTQSTWNVSTGDGLTENPATQFDIRFGGEGFSPPVDLTKVDVTLAGSTVGTFAAATNAFTVIEGNRSGLTKNELDNTGGTQAFRLGTSDAVASPLPIQLLSFSATLNKYIVELKWITKTEINNDFFTVERTKDGINFSEICRVKGAGNSNETILYTEHDKNPLTGTNFYRLKQTDFNGKFTYSQLVAINIAPSFEFAISPNPISLQENLILNISGLEKEKEILVVVNDMNGKESFAKIIITGSTGNGILAFDPSKNLSSGVYIITATSDQKIYKQKLVIQ